MQYRVIGAIRATGQDCEVVLDALTASAAEETANGLGIMVEQVADNSPPAPRDSVSSPPLRQLAVANRVPVQRVPSARAPVANRLPVMTIEKTSKSWKAMLLLFVLLILAGLVALIGDSDHARTLLGMGILGIIVTKTLIWWHHG